MLPAQITSAAPALTVAAAFMVSTMDETAAGHGPAGSLVVMVNVTVPLEISVAPGVYTGFTTAVLLNVPSPEVVQVEEVALPPRVAPDNV